MAKFGEEALAELQAMVAQQQAQQAPTEGMLSGPGGGMGDQIPASVQGNNPVALSSGEFIVPADVVSMMGDGDSSSGAAKLEQMMAQVRQQKTGSTQQATPLREGGIAALR